MCDAVDLNLGCPQAIAKRGGYGAFLLEDTATCAAIVSALAGGLSVPVTVKIRLLPDPADTLRTVLALQAAGASAIAIHGRRRDELKERTGFCNWEAIAAVRAHPDVRVPIIANGGIASAADVAACLAATRADAVMVSEALLEDPGLFAAGAPARPLRRAGASSSDALHLANEYLAFAALFDESPGAVRGHLMKMLFAPLKIHRDLRIDVLRAQSIAEWRQALRRLAHAYGHAVAAEPAPEEAAAEAAALRAWATTAPPYIADAAVPPPQLAAGELALLRPRAPAAAAAIAAALTRRNERFERKAAKKAARRATAAAAGAAAGAHATAGDSVPPSKRRRCDGGAATSGDDEDDDVEERRVEEGATAEGAGAVVEATTAVAAPTAEASEQKAATNAADAAAELALLETTDWASMTGRAPRAADVAEWAARRAAAPNAGLSPPAFLVDPLQPGLWYMRHQGSAYGGRGARRDGPAAFLAQLAVGSTGADTDSAAPSGSAAAVGDEKVGAHDFGGSFVVGAELAELKPSSSSAGGAT